MRSVVTMKVAALFLALVSAALAMPRARFPGIQRQQSLRSITNQYCFILTLPEFTARRNRREPPNLDWSSDGCTAAPNNPFGFPFLPGCHRHDFGYRNFRRQNRFNRSNKKAIDEQLKSEYVPPLHPRRPGNQTAPLAPVPMLLGHVRLSHRSEASPETSPAKDLLTRPFHDFKSLFPVRADQGLGGLRKAG